MLARVRRVIDSRDDASPANCTVIELGNIERLSPVIVHLIRNAVDHGIEPPEVREGRGKDAEALIVIRFEQHGNLLTVDVSDDGNGFDTDRIKVVAIERGVATADRLASMTTSEVHQLVFLPGFSTSREVTETFYGFSVFTYTGGRWLWVGGQTMLPRSP